MGVIGCLGWDAGMCVCVCVCVGGWLAECCPSLAVWLVWFGLIWVGLVWCGVFYFLFFFIFFTV
jgi:hypothetical protein